MIFAALISAFLTDTGAYFSGYFFGKHKLIPEVSPKKTVEGAIGAVFAAMGATVIFAYCIDVFIESITVNYIVLAVYAFVGSICAMFGDLVASLIKRSFGVKDFGNLIPGHGGILDRFDSVLFVAPLMYYFMQYLPIL